MINVENILNAELINDPWPHKIIDDILSPDAFARVCKIAETFTDLTFNEPIEKCIEAEELDLLPTVMLEALQNELENISQQILEPFTDNRNNEHGFYCITPRYNITKPYARGEIHDEAPIKLMSLIIYISPKFGLGTRIYDGPAPENFVKQIEWKSNRALLMCARTGRTWHAVHNNTDSNRITLNCFFYLNKPNG